jgi:hypothetical protein
VSRGRHARDGQRRDTISRWLHGLRVRAHDWCWWHAPYMIRGRRAAAWLDRLQAPAPASGPEQAPRPADPPSWRAARCGPGQRALVAAAKLAFGTDADGPGGPLEHLPSCDGTCGGAIVHAARLDDGWCPCCYCAQFAVTPAPGAAPGQAPDAGATPSPAAAALPPAPEDATATLPPPEPGPPQAGRGQPVYAVRRDGIIAVSSTGRLAVIPAASTLPAVRLRPTAALDAVTAPDPVWAAAGPDLHSQVTETSAVRPYYTAHEASRDEAANAPVDYWPAYLPAAAAR